uniref:Uncharacterized protein n=1 Tax=Octopus bimaculoides TaxID=37653 RepID=A0A0L8G780_OCTBM
MHVKVCRCIWNLLVEIFRKTENKQHVRVDERQGGRLNKRQNECLPAASN